MTKSTKDEENIGLYKIQIASSGSYSVKSEDIYRDKEASLSTLRELRQIVSGYKKEQVKPSQPKREDLKPHRG